ncbi:hypothetical protein ACFWUT_23485 [Streptomyces cyaneofuscatus]|uniref:hypothetical protein n=1 Tax=Streptomyces cyaneofuscatus TaxID=66883 RepID=UPI0036636592
MTDTTASLAAEIAEAIPNRRAPQIVADYLARHRALVLREEMRNLRRIEREDTPERAIGTRTGLLRAALILDERAETTQTALVTAGSVITRHLADGIAKEPAQLPDGITAHNCVTLKCPLCGYFHDEDEGYTVHFDSVAEAQNIAHSHEWRVLADGRVICPSDDEDHQALQRDIGLAPSPE